MVYFFVFKLCVSKFFVKYISWRESTAEYLTLHLYFPLVMAVYKNKKDPLQAHELQQFAPGSLGNETWKFLQARQLDLFCNYEEHDFKHVLLNYDINLTQEVAMQFFEFGNGNRSFPVLLILVAGPVIAPECWKIYHEAYRRGKKAVRIDNALLKHQLNQDLIQLRKHYNLI